MDKGKNSKPQPRRIGLWIFVTGIILLTCIYILRSVLIAPFAIAFAEHTIAENHRQSGGNLFF
jgi:hypothetical protein